MNIIILLNYCQRYLQVLFPTVKKSLYNFITLKYNNTVPAKVRRKQIMILKDGSLFMKKVIALAMAALMLVMAIAFVGCDKKDNDKEADATNAPAQESDLDYIKKKGKLTIGVTDFKPMDYQDANGNWIGFDADYAKAFCAYIGVDADIVAIEWDNKETELAGKSIDCVWNGMTLTDGVKEAMETSVAYCDNAQVVVLKKDIADKYTTPESILTLKFAVENGSAGDELITAAGAKDITRVTAQSDALLEVKSGTAEACVIDLLMANAMTGEGTDYADLTYTVRLNSEQYGVGFRKGSDLAAKLNEFFKVSYADGTAQKLAETYKVGTALIEQK